MKNQLRKVLPAGAACVVTLSVGGYLSVPAALADVTTTPKVSLSQAEQIAKSTFDIPTNYKLQNESFNSGMNSPMPPSYYLYYHDPNSTGAQTISVTMNANTGSVINYSKPTVDNEFQFPVPVNADKAKAVADKWAQTLFPNQFPDVKPVPLQPHFRSLQGPTSYTFTYERMVNGIPAPFDGFRITIDQVGQLIGVQDHWTSLSFPSATPKLSQADANKVYQSALDLSLQYQSIWHQNSKPTTELDYNPAPQSLPNYWGQQFTDDSMAQYPAISAQTGEILDSTGSTYKPASQTPPQPLVPGGPANEQSTTHVNWSQSQAMAYAKQIFGISDKDKLQNVNQYQNPQQDQTWQFSWLEPDGTSLNVTVDATLGRISNYNAYNNKPAGNGKPAPSANAKLTQSQIQTAIKNFVKKVYPNDTGDIGIEPEPFKNPDGSPQTFYRLITFTNGIPNMAESGSINVNPQTGQVRSLYLNMRQMSGNVPDPSKALSKDTAVQKWITERPLTLEYLETQPQYAAKLRGKDSTDTSPKVILMYVPVSNAASSGWFNAITGTFDSNDAKVPYTGTVKDIQGLTAQPQLQLLVHRELITVDKNGDVHPDQSMTHGAFIKLLVDALGYQGRIDPMAMKSAAAHSALAMVPANAPDASEIRSAYSNGWIPSDQPFNPNATTTRDYAAQVLARALNMTSLLGHADAFAFSPNDASNIPNGDKAGDALAVTLGMLSLDNGSFQPGDPLTLSDAAVAVVQAAVIVGAERHPYPIRY